MNVWSFIKTATFLRIFRISDVISSSYLYNLRMRRYSRYLTAFCYLSFVGIGTPDWTRMLFAYAFGASGSGDDGKYDSSCSSSRGHGCHKGGIPTHLKNLLYFASLSWFFVIRYVSWWACGSISVISFCRYPTSYLDFSPQLPQVASRTAHPSWPYGKGSTRPCSWQMWLRHGKKRGYRPV